MKEEKFEQVIENPGWGDKVSFWIIAMTGFFMGMFIATFYSTTGEIIIMIVWVVYWTFIICISNRISRKIYWRKVK